MHQHTPVTVTLTFAELHSFEPAMVKFSAASTSTILVPRATRSAATYSSRLLKFAAVRTCFNDNWRSGRRDD